MKDLIKKINGVKKVSVGTKYLAPSEYIRDIIDQLRNDIFPLFQGSPFFTIARNTFCFIDHISALKFGTTNQTTRIKALLGEFAKFDRYLNRKYQNYSSFIVQVYRHDLVHNIRPFPHKIQIIEEDGTKADGISWFHITQQTISMPNAQLFNQLAQNFENINFRKNLFHLRYSNNQVIINNNCLFFDLVNFLNQYENMLEKDVNEQNKFVNNYKKIANKYFSINNFILDKTKDKECKTV